MTILFPEVQPTAATFTAPEVPTTESQSYAGVRSVRAWGSVAVDGGLDLQFDNVLQSDGAAIVKAHREARGPVEELTLPPILFKNVNPALLDEVAAIGGALRWFFVKGAPPQLTRSPGGRRCSVRVQLRAELRAG
jgi:hypothetical protein